MVALASIRHWEAVFGPICNDGYFKPAWYHPNGTIDHRVDTVLERERICFTTCSGTGRRGPQALGKLHVYVGDADTFYLNRDVRAVQAWLKTTSNPHYEGFFMYCER